MAREDLYFVNVTCIYGYAGSNRMGWQATVHWQDGKFAEFGAVEGKISTRYFEPTLSGAIDAIIEVAEQWQLKTLEELEPSLFYEGDSENKDYPPPENWKETLFEEAQKRGWTSYLSWETKEVES